MEDQNLKFLQDLFLYSQKVCSWSITSDMQLIYSNCPEQEFFFNAFLTSSCCAAVQAHFALFRSPLLVSDRTGFVWIAVCGPAKSDKPSLTYLLGPMFTTDTTRTHLYQLCRKMHLSVETTERLGKFIGDVPTVSTNISTSYATALHYCVTGDAVSVDDVEVRIERIDRSEDMAWGDVSWHGSWVMEQRLFKSIMEGRYEDFSKINIGSIGNMGGGDNLRQAKNEIIVFAVLCSRAAILGGVSVEGALSLSDYFIQLVEAADTVPEAVSIGAEMQQTYLQRVRKAKANSNRTALVRSCMEYVETHILEKISLKDMALEVGYNEQYISRKFKSETGESLIDYINGQKVELSKVFFRDEKLSIAEISDKLSFSSPSYFSSVFKKQAGMSPVEYQQGQKEANE